MNVMSEKPDSHASRALDRTPGGIPSDCRSAGNGPSTPQTTGAARRQPGILLSISQGL